MREILKLGSVLFIVCEVSALALSLTYVFTLPRIEAKEAADIKKALGEVMPDSTGFEKIENDDFTYYIAYSGVKEDISGYIVIAKGKGYTGPIVVMTGVDGEGAITGIKILDQKETPGLGSKISGEDFLSQFIGKTGQKVDVSKEKAPDNIMAISGATISSRAVTEAVRSEIEKLLRLLEAEDES